VTHAALPDELEPPELDEPPLPAAFPALADGLAAAE